MDKEERGRSDKLETFETWKCGNDASTGRVSLDASNLAAGAGRSLAVQKLCFFLLPFPHFLFARPSAANIAHLDLRPGFTAGEDLGAFVAVAVHAALPDAAKVRFHFGVG